MINESWTNPMCFWLVFWCMGIVQPEQGESNKQDELLIARVKSAIAEKISIDKVEAHVRQKAALNTASNKDGLLRGGPGQSHLKLMRNKGLYH